MKALELFRDGLTRWWLEASFTRKMGDAIVALMFGTMLLCGKVAYENRDALWRLLSVQMGQYTLDHHMAKIEAAEFISSVAARGAHAVYVFEVDLAQQRRGVIAHATVPNTDKTQFFEELATRYLDVPLISVPAQYTLYEYRNLMEGKAFWSMSPTLGYMRFVVPIPPLFGAQTIGMIVVMCDPMLDEAAKVILENRALRWATRMSGL